MKEHLQRVRKLRSELEFVKLKICDLEYVKPKTNVIQLVPTFGGKNAHGLDELLCRKEQLICEYDALLGEYCEMYDVALGVVGQLDGLERKVLELFYLHGKTWKQVCDSLHISQSWCFKLHARALHKIVKDSYNDATI